MKHTPGPWTSDGAQIFTDQTNIAQAHGFRVDPETVAANARLIAAAPALLAALQSLLDYPNLGAYARAEAVNAARAAISNATGADE